MLKNRISPRPGPLDHFMKVKEFTNSLRTERGRYSPELISEIFGMAPGELLSIAGLPEQILLEFLARIARMRLRLSEAEFCNWLRAPNPQLEGRTPLQCIEEGHVQILADYVEDVLTGSPN